ncbi:MAG: hypothetical protein P9M14_03245 [Candidatus Alcyoniella australis]|nr:hypothetical protein [Candidatus Alcyoniella australis]
MCYLTGRDSPGMGSGTRASLSEHGFPFDCQRVDLLMKPRIEIKDMDFKRDAVRQIGEMGQVLAAFDNEPGNINLFADTFPEAIVVLLDTIHSPTPVVPYEHVVRISDFNGLADRKE